MSDRVRCFKLEDTVSGGSQVDLLPTEVNPNQDGVDCNALFLQSTTSADSTTYVNRSTSGGMTFTDGLAGSKQLNHLVSSALADNSSHQALIDIIHFLDDGPGDGWASGAVKVRNNAQPNGTGWVWYTSSAQTSRIIDYTINYASGTITPSTRVWRLYATDGKTVVRTLTDTLTFSGPVLMQTARSWS